MQRVPAGVAPPAIRGYADFLPRPLNSALLFRNILLRFFTLPTGRFAAFLLCGIAWSAQAQPEPPSPVFVLNSLDATVSVIDPVTWTEQRRIPTGKEPHHLYMTPDEKSVIVANSGGD